jgi:ADP-ribosyl-[dinitrogen reductase] hydrolase
MTTQITHEAVRGALLGLAAGDARGGTGAATELALRLASSIAQLGGYDADDALRHYVAWHRTDPSAGGQDMRSVLQLIAAGEGSFRATSSFATASGNGALIRTTPIGLAYAGSDEALRDATLADAALTHFDPLAGKVALLHNQALSWLLVGGPQMLFDQLKNPEWLDDRIEDVVIPATSGVRGFAETLAESDPGSALASLAAGLVVVFNADSFEEGVGWAVSLPGDRSANGAVAGALLGARLGVNAIPADWLAALPRRAELEGLAERLQSVAA